MPAADLIREAAIRFGERSAERPSTGTGSRPRKKQRQTRDAAGQPKEYARKVSRAEKELLVAALHAIAARADDGISGVRGTDSEWVWFARRTIGEKIQETTVPLRRGAWRLLLGHTPQETLPSGESVEVQVWENVVSGDTVTEVAVLVRDAAGAVMFGSADPAAAEYLPLDARTTSAERELVAERLADAVRVSLADHFVVGDADVEAMQARLDENAKTGRAPKVVISGGAILLIFATWITWQYRYLQAHTVDFVVDAALTVDGKAGALVRWRDLDPESGDSCYIYRDGRIAHTMDIPSGTRGNHPETFAWFDDKIKFGENHTYKLGRKLARSIIIDVGNDVDLKPCWKCLEDVLHTDTFRFDDETRRIIEQEKDAFDLWAIAGFPKRFGGRIAAAHSSADPTVVPPVSTVRVDFGDGTPPAIYDSNNIVHTYTAPGLYTIRVTDLQSTPVSLEPIPIRVLGRTKIPSLRIARLVKVDEKSPFAFALAAIPGHPTILPLHRFLGAIHADLRGEFVENLYMNVDWHDGTVEELDVRKHVRRAADGYAIDLKAQHQWTEKKVPQSVTVLAASEELGRVYVGSIPIVTTTGRSPLPRINPKTEVWFVVLDDNKELHAPIGQPWSFSTVPWLHAVRDGHDLFDPATAEVAVDFGAVLSKITGEAIPG